MVDGRFDGDGGSRRREVPGRKEKLCGCAPGAGGRAVRGRTLEKTSMGKAKQEDVGRTQARRESGMTAMDDRSAMATEMAVRKLGAYFASFPRLRSAADRRRHDPAFSIPRPSTSAMFR